MTDAEKVPFALAMASVSGSTPFVVLVFDDGAAVSLHSVRALALELGLKLPEGTVFDLIEDWDRTFPALATLVHVLAHGDQAQGHRGDFVAEDLLTMELLLGEARQIIRVGDGEPRISSITAQVGASASINLNETMQSANANPCLAAIVGKLCHHVNNDTAEASIAGFTLTTEIVQTDKNGFERSGAPGSVIVGPLFVPAIFAAPFLEGDVMLALTGAPAVQTSLASCVANLGEQISTLSQSILLLPGDIVITGPPASTETTKLGNVDTIEVVAKGFGRQTISLY